MKILVATLCDHASVRDNLLTVVSGGITQYAPEVYPCPLMATLALMCELTPINNTAIQELEIRVQDEDGGEITTAVGAVSVERREPDSQGLDAGVSLQVPFVIDLRPAVIIPQPGRYQITIDPRSEHATEVVLAFRAMEIGSADDG